MKKQHTGKAAPPPEPLPLANRVALVTGAGKRIGREIALQLARAGSNVVVNYNTSREQALEVAAEIRVLGRKAVALRADVANAKQIQKMFRVVEERFGTVDVLVNNSGMFFERAWDRLTPGDWDRILNVNLKGVFFCSQAAARLMLKHGGGRIINISSLGGLQAWPGYTHYCASKAGVIAVTRCLAKALAPSILVNSVAPGTIVFPGEERSRMMRRLIESAPLKKGGSGSDIASMVVYLASERGFITGQTFAVDGGKSIP